MVRGGGGVPSVGHVGQSSVIIDGAGGGVPSVGHVGQSSVIIDGAGGGGEDQVSDMWVNQV